jgi:dihydroorotate dehydrogenase (NAD+) catalytic subunit
MKMSYICWSGRREQTCRECYDLASSPLKLTRENSLVKNRLNVNVVGLDLVNPTMLASGVLGYSAETLESMVEGGAAAVVTKSIGAKPRRGYDNPTVAQVSCGLLNAMGLPNPGIEEFAREIRRIKTVLRVPVIVSVYGYSGDDYALVAKKAVRSGADAVELNVSCPHVEKTGLEIGQDPELLAATVREVKTVVDKPVVVKLSPNVTSIVDLGEVAVKAGADAITAINTVRGMAVDAETAMPVLSNRVGGLSGPVVKPIALRCVYELFEQVKIPIIGCGGVSNWRDAAEFLLAGACAVQIGTAVATKGSGVFSTIARGLNAYLKSKGFESVNQIVGLSHVR